MASKSVARKKKSRELKCPVCHLILSSKSSNLRRHMKLHDPIVKCYICIICEKPYQNPTNFRKHWTEKHSEFGEPQCHESNRKSQGNFQQTFSATQNQNTDD